MKIYLKYNDNREYTYDNKEDFITVIGADAWDAGFCTDANDFLEAVDFAINMLNLKVTIVE